MANGDDESRGKLNPGWRIAFPSIAAIAVSISLIGMAAGGLWWVAGLDSRVSFIEKTTLTNESFRAMLKAEGPWVFAREGVVHDIEENKETVRSLNDRMRLAERDLALILQLLKRIEKKLDAGGAGLDMRPDGEPAIVQDGGRGCG